VLALAGRYADAQHEVERALLLNARSFQTHLMKGWVAEMSGDPDAAFAAYRDGLRVAGAADAVVTRSEAAFRAGGLPGYYRMWLDYDGAGGPMSETWRAQMYVRTGDVDRAIAALEHAYQKREGALAWVNVEPSFQPLRADPRFRRIADRVGRRP
jgi:tetratricopeptide (TPR) repeat protein